VTVEGYAKRLLPRSPRDVVGMLAPHGSVEGDLGPGEGRVVQVGSSLAPNLPQLHHPARSRLPAACFLLAAGTHHHN
jgi:hypothetical protein